MYIRSLSFVIPLLVLCFALLTIIVNPAEAKADTIYVDDSAGPGGNGTSWALAFDDLQDALDEVANVGTPCEIWVAAGTYTPSAEHGGSGDHYKSFQMQNGVGIYGGFTGTETARNQRTWETNETVLSGDIGIPVYRLDNCYNVFYHPASLKLNSTAVIDGFTITNGHAYGISYDKATGGGMFNDNCSPAIVHCTFSHNTSSWGGAGMSNDNHSSPLITECRFHHNNTDGYGGAMENANHSSPSLISCAIIENSSMENGGAIFNRDYSSPVLDGCIVTNNHADIFGGGIYNATYSSPKLSNCSISENTADGDGGGIYNYCYSSPILSDCVLYENTSQNYGGGIYNEMSSSPKLYNSVLYRNSAYLGGGMYNHSGCLPEVANCTFWGNSGGAGAIYNSYYSSPTVTNSILWNNSYLEIYSTGTSTPNITYSNVEGGYPGDGNIDQPPMLVNPKNHDFHLQTISPCINAGTNSALNLPAEDYEGHPRIIDGIADMGVDEFMPGGTPTYAVTIMVDPVEGGTVALDPPGGTYYEGAIVTLTATPSAQHEFAFWSGDLAGNTNPDTLLIDSNKSVTAHFAEEVLPVNIIHVNWASDPGGDGSSWQQAFMNLQDGLSAASGYQTEYEIWVASGTYTPGESRNSSFKMKNNVGIYGGFLGYEIDRGERDWETNRTVLSGEIGIPGFKDDDCYHVISNTTNQDESAVLDGFTVTGGNANVGGTESTGLGGGIYNNGGASPTIRNCAITDNYASYGGGVYNRGDSCPTIINCLFTNNIANTGGAMRNYSDSDPTVVDCMFINNGYIYVSDGPYPSPTPPSEPTLTGEAINNDDSSPIFTNCTFTGQQRVVANYNISFPRFTDCIFTENGNGVLNNQHSSAKFTGCSFTNNSGYGVYSTDESNSEFIDCSFIENDKGIINGSHSSPTITNCTFVGNTGGGIYNDSYCSPDISNSTFLQNSADEGGAIYNHYQSSPTITNSIFGFNCATSGGAIYNETGCVPLVTNCTFWNNSASQGGTMYSTDFCIPEVTNSILWGGSPQEIDNGENSSLNIRYSDIQGGYTGAGNINQQPMLSGDFHLIPTSPCIDAGTNSAPEMPTEDYEGDPRIINGRADMGIDEYWPPWIYDTNQNSKIEYVEMVDALMDYLTSTLSYSQMIDVLMCYLIS